MNAEQLHSHVAYTLDKGDKLSELGLKTIQTRPITYGIVPGNLLINGTNRLIYPTSELSSLKMLDSRITAKEAMEMLHDMAVLIGTVDDSAFLDRRMIDFRLEYVFMSQEEATGRFIIVPVEEAEKRNKEEEVKNFLDFLIGKCNASNKLISEYQKLLPEDFDSESALGAIYKIFKDADSFSYEENVKEQTKNDRQVVDTVGNQTVDEVELRYRGPQGSFAFFDRKTEFLIGKEEGSDGVISLNPAISRKHCKIINAGTEAFVEDMGSKNGTSVNDTKIMPGQKAALHDGDKLKVADMVFDVILHTR